MRGFINCSKVALVGLCLNGAVNTAAYAEEPSPLHYLNIQTIHPHTRDAFLEAMRHNATQSRTEPANIVFDVADPGGNDPTVVLFESWRDRAGYLQHEASAHVAPVLALVPTSFAKPERKYLLENAPGLPAPERKVIAQPTTTHNVIDLAELKAASHNDFVKQATTEILEARQQPGNLAFNVYQVHDQPNTFVVYQRWVDAQAYADFRSRPAAQSFEENLSASSTNARETLVLRDRILE
ncbi:putative quinol monooxygenase [Pseudomonas sp. NPDC089752]|uniref:putative quinol monooxygenase n=1 Tax=Pseudomonas sp. NPDC089752 TaxID=3364472 RepID=UPI0037FD0166